MVIVVTSRAVKVVSDISDVEKLTFAIESLTFIARAPLHYEVLSETLATCQMACTIESGAFGTHYL
jgi:hypothetical protein